MAIEHEYLVSDETRSVVFSDLCDAERSIRLYSREHLKHVKTHKWLRILQSIPFVAPILITLFDSEWATVPRNIQILVGLGCLLLLYIGTRKDEYKAAVAHFVQEQCGGIKLELRELLADIDQERISDEEARDRLYPLSEELDSATNKARIAKIVVSESKLSKMQKEIVESLGGSFNG